jgi:hypothetical protein
MPHLYSLPQHDNSQRCQHTGICDGDYSCGPDGLGCVTSAKQRQEHVRKAISWSWEGYRCVSHTVVTVTVLIKFIAAVQARCISR